MTYKIDPLPKLMIEDMIKDALKEDLGRGGDATTRAVIDTDTKATVIMRARDDGVAAGLDVAALTFAMIDPDLVVHFEKRDGANFQKGDALLKISGCMQSILTAERVALNFLGRMTAIATLTDKMVQAIKPHGVKIACTRKTTPNLRALEKYAVRCGGGSQHRLGLDDCIMIKDNHIAANGGDIALTLKRAKDYAGHTTKIEVEVDTLEQLDEVLAVGMADIILLDNMSPAMLKAAVEKTQGRAILEASGGITLETIADVAASGVDVISVGALTHSAGCLDIGLDYAAAQSDQVLKLA